MSKLLAPNGKPSNLTPEQYALVRTPQFKAWFGDWENNPESASKIVDENGEPLMVFHGTNQKFTIFSLDKVGSNVDYGMWGSGFYFSPIKSFSKSYGNNIMKVFLSIRNPSIKNPNLTGSSSQFKPVYGKEQSIQLRNDILDADFDGVIQYESGQKNLITQIIAFHPEQIKLADGTNITFDENNPDIRYEQGGNTQQSLEVKLVQDKDLSNELLNIAYVELGYVGQPRLALLENGKIIGGIFLEKPSSYIENGEYVVQPMWEYKFDIVIVKSKRNKGYSKILLDAMIQDFVSNFPDADQIRAEVTNKKLEKSLQKNYGFSCDSGNDEKITYCYLSKEDGEKYKNTANIKFENGGTTKKNMKKVDKGGITYGRSHAEGGIPVKNESTGQMLEVEGGEGIINKKAMASPQMVKIDGKEMTICEAASYLNQKDGNGRQFNCDDVEHQQFLTDHYGVGGTVMNNQDAENAMFDATVFEHGGTVNAYDAGLHKKMYMLGIEVMQPDPIALARVMSDENDNFCEHYPKLCAGAEYQREELPQIYDKNYDEFVAYLENLGATVNFEGDTAVDSLKPVQNEISLERMARIMARVKDGYYKDLNLLKLPLFVSKDGYILDGHHRWATLFFLSPTNTLDIYRVNLTYKELVDNALNFDDAGTEKFMIGGMVKKQSELDTAKSQTVKFKEGKITFYYDFQDLRFFDVVRLEGSSQALMSKMFKQPLFTMYGSLGIFISALLNKELAFIAQELEKTKSFTRWNVFTEPTVTKEKRSQAIDITLDYMRTAYGVRDWFDDQSIGSNKGYGVFAQLYTLATKNFIIEIIQNLQEGDWTYAPLTVNDFTGTDKYRNAAEVYHKNIEKIFTVIEEQLEQSRQNIDFDITTADLNLVTLPNTASSAPTQKFSNWRFKTDEELTRDYGNYKFESWWSPSKDYLFGQKITFSAEGQKFFEDYVFKKKSPSETPVVNTKELFGVTSDDDDVWTVVYQMVTQDPLPNAATTSSQVISAYKKAFFGSESDLSNEYNLTQTKFKEIRRYTYMSWEDLVYFYNKAAALQPEVEAEFVRAVYIVINNARTGGFFSSIDEVRYSLQNNDPNDLMKALFGQTYYFAPLTYEFYYFNFERYVTGWSKTAAGSKRLQIPTSPELDDMIQIPQISSYINITSQKDRGLIGLGCSTTKGGVSYYPDIVTNLYTSNILDAFGKSDIEILNISEISKNLRYNNNSVSYGFFETQTESGEYVRPEFTLLGSVYGKFFVNLYNQWSDITTDKTYIYGDDSPLKNFQFNTKPLQDNEYIYTPFTEDLIEPVYVITDVDALLTNFQAHNIIAPREYSAMYDVCKKCKLFKGQPNDNFLNDYYYGGTSLNLGQLLSNAVGLTADEEKTLKDFLNLFKLWVVERSMDYVMGKVRDAYENNKLGVNTTQRTQFTVPAPTQQKPLPSTDPSTWGEYYTISDNVKIRYDYSTDLGNGASLVPYDSPQNVFKITGQKIIPVMVRPENPTGKFYTLNNGQDWEGKDLELVRSAFAQPLPATPPATQTQQGKPQTREVYYNELLYKGVLKKNEKIVGARFLTEDEIKKMDKSYNLDKLSFGTILIAQDFINGKKSDVAEYVVTNNIWYNDLLGQKLDDNLLPMVKQLFTFQKSLDVADSKEIFRSSYEQSREIVKETRLRLGTGTFNYGNSEVRFLFPKLGVDDYENADKFNKIELLPFPDWYKAVIKQLYKSREGSSYRQDFDTMRVGQDIIDPYYFFTGQRLDKFSNTSAPYLEFPTSYLMLEIEDTSAPVKTQVIATSNPESIKKLKEEYSALQYYLNVEVPIDAFAQRKLISSVMADISNKLEQQIESLYYAPSFEPLFELWADKQTQGQRTINLQPCMLPTPNGEKSELDLVQYEIVRTEEFKKWFGDWEEAAVTGNYNGVSKAINPLTKEPQVVFHGKANMLLEFTKMGFATFPIKYFGTNLSYAEWFRENQSSSNTLIKLVYEFFLDIKNPIDLSPIGLTELTAEDFKEVIKAQYNYTIQSPIVSEGTGVKLKLWNLIRGSSDMLQELKTNTYFDGIIMYEDNPSDSTSLGYESNLLGFSPNSYEIVQKVAGNAQGNFTLDYVTFTNFQIKAADGRNKTFFNKVEDFRFAKGGITKKQKK